MSSLPSNVPNLAETLTKPKLAAAQRFANGKLSVDALAEILTPDELRDVSAALVHNLSVIAGSRLFAHDAPRERWTVCVAELAEVTS